MWEPKINHFLIRVFLFWIDLLWISREGLWPLLKIISHLLQKGFKISDSNGIRTHHHLVCTRTLNKHRIFFIKWLRCVERIYLYSAFGYLLLLYHVRVSHWIYTLKIPECQGTPRPTQVQYLKLKWKQQDSDPQPLSS